MKSKFIYVGTIILLIILLYPTVALGWSPYGQGLGQSYGGGPWRSAGFRISRDADRDNYYVTIRLGGIDPQDLSITVERGRWLAIRRQGANTSHFEDQSDDRGGYYRSYSYSSSSGVRRLSLPRNADAAAMQRENGADLVKITIPRRR